MPRFELDEAQIDLPPGAAFNAKLSWTTRRSLRLRWFDDDGLVVRGEAAPLPGWSRESLETARRDLERCAAELSEGATPRARRVLDAREPAELLRSSSPLAQECCNSARFALESVLFERLSHRLGLPTWQLLRSLDPLLAATPEARLLDPARPVATAGAFDLRHPSAISSSTLKVKIGRDTAEEQRLLRVLRQAHPELRLRLDANQSLRPERLLGECLGFAACQPEWIEEPCSLPALGRPRALPVGLAFDESLALAEAQPETVNAIRAWVSTGAVTALVLKPAFLGGLEAVLRWCELARGADVAIVVSHLFDGAIAAASYRQLALAFGSPRVAMGLGPHAGLALWEREPT